MEAPLSSKTESPARDRTGVGVALGLVVLALAGMVTVFGDALVALVAAPSVESAAPLAPAAEPAVEPRSVGR